MSLNNDLTGNAGFLLLKSGILLLVMVSYDSAHGGSYGDPLATIMTFISYIAEN